MFSFHVNSGVFFFHLEVHFQLAAVVIAIISRNSDGSQVSRCLELSQCVSQFRSSKDQINFEKFMKIVIQFPKELQRTKLLRR